MLLVQVIKPFDLASPPSIEQEVQYLPCGPIHPISPGVNDPVFWNPRFEFKVWSTNPKMQHVTWRPCVSYGQT